MNADKTYFVGLDLGQSRNHSALAVVERAGVFLGEMDWVTYERPRKRWYRVMLLGRARLGRRIATGVGAPVVDMLRRADLGCGIEPF